MEKVELVPATYLHFAYSALGVSSRYAFDIDKYIQIFSKETVRCLGNAFDDADYIFSTQEDFPSLVNIVVKTVTDRSDSHLPLDPIGLKSLNHQYPPSQHLYLPVVARKTSLFYQDGVLQVPVSPYFPLLPLTATEHTRVPLTDDLKELHLLAIRVFRELSAPYHCQRFCYKNRFWQALLVHCLHLIDYLAFGFGVVTFDPVTSDSIDFTCRTSITDWFRKYHRLSNKVARLRKNTEHNGLKEYFTWWHRTARVHCRIFRNIGRGPAYLSGRN